MKVGVQSAVSGTKGGDERKGIDVGTHRYMERDGRGTGCIEKSSGVRKLREGVPQHGECSEEGANGVRKNVDEWWCRQFVTGGQFMEEVERCVMQTMLRELTCSVGFDTWYESRHTMRMRYTERVQKQTKKGSQAFLEISSYWWTPLEGCVIVHGHWIEWEQQIRRRMELHGWRGLHDERGTLEGFLMPSSGR